MGFDSSILQTHKRYKNPIFKKNNMHKVYITNKKDLESACGSKINTPPQQFQSSYSLMMYPKVYRIHYQ